MHCNVDSDCYMPTTICEATRKVCVCTPGYSFVSATNSCDPGKV